MAAKRKTKKKAEKVSVVDEHKSIIDCVVDMGRANASKFLSSILAC